MTEGEAPVVDMTLPPLRLANAEFIEAMGARQGAIDSQCRAIQQAMNAGRYEDAGATYMFDLRQQHTPIHDGAKELKRMIERSATLRSLWRRYTEHYGIFVWQEVTDERGNHFLQHCRLWAQRLESMKGTGTWCLSYAWRGWVEDVLGHVDMWVGGVPMTDWHVPLATTDESCSPFTTPVTAVLSDKEEEITLVWTVQPDDNRQTRGNVKTSVETRNLPTRVLIGYPTQRRALVNSIMRDCGNSWRMWVAYQGDSPTCKSQDMYVDKRRCCHNTTVTIEWVVCEWRPDGLQRIDLHKYIQGLSNVCKRGRGAWRLPPGTNLGDREHRRRHHAAALDALQAERAQLLESGKDLEAMAANMAKTWRVLQDSEKRWIKRVLGQSKISEPSWMEYGTWVYVIMSIADGTVYVGETGGKGEKRRIMDRFWEHVVAARSLRSGANKVDPTWKRWQRAMSCMGSAGLESWIIVPVERVTTGTRLIRECSWIRRMGKTYNCKRTWGRGRAQALGQRALRDEGPGNVDDLTAQAEKVAHALRVPESAAQLVRLLLASRKRVPKDVESKLYQKVKGIIRQRLGIHLPRVLAVPVPAGKDVDIQPTMDAMKAILTEYAAPKWLHRYLLAVIRPVGKRGKKVKDMIAPTTLRGSMEQALSKSEKACNCARRPAGVPRMDGCCIARNPAHLRLLFGDHAAVLMQNLDNATAADWGTATETVDRFARQLSRSFPRGTGPSQCIIAQSVKLTLRPEFQKIEGSVPPHLTVQALKKFQKAFPHWKITPLDKNGGRAIAMCGKLYWSKTIQAFNDEKQFEELSVEQDHQTANEVALQKLAAAAQDKGLAEFWKETATSGPPSAYCLPKNKMTEEVGGAWKARVIFSHFSHPIKARGKIIGRALSLLLKTATAHMHCFEMVDIRDVKGYAEQVQKSLDNIVQSGENPQGIGEGGFRFWELDVVEMFPRLDRQKVMEALKAIHTLVGEARKVRGKNPQCWFALHQYDRRLDRMGKGSSRHFTSLHPLPYCPPPGQ